MARSEGGTGAGTAAGPESGGPVSGTASGTASGGPGTAVAGPAGDGAVAADAAPATQPGVMAGSLGEYTRLWLRRIRSGESGALPVVIGLVAIVIYFQVRSPLFLSAGNLVNLMTQAAFIITLGMAEVFVLLLGDIDLSSGYNAALGAVVMAWMLSLAHPLPWWLAAAAGLAFSAVFAGLQGIIIVWLRLPSFVVTLAGSLGGFGLLLFLIEVAAPGSGGTIRVDNNIISNIEGGALSPLASWIVMAVAVALTGLVMWTRDARRRSAGLTAPPASVSLLKIALVAVAGITVVLIGNQNRGVGFNVVEGVPWVVLLLLVLLVGWTILLGRTRFGRYVYAMGGNAEAAGGPGSTCGGSGWRRSRWPG
jgi:D-xylose transport system permease protein